MGLLSKVAKSLSKATGGGKDKKRVRDSDGGFRGIAAALRSKGAEYGETTEAKKAVSHFEEDKD